MTNLAELRDIQKSRRGQYDVRTRFLDASGEPLYVNQLILEQSPYLLQHAHNPVNWHSWSDATFSKARTENRPVFLSIGYSTCHWCHVMEEESFDNEKVAALLNQHFVAIKVDREQRPDLDDIYMMAVQIISGRGGWPMSVFLTPEGQPFYGGTYFQTHRFTELLNRIQQIWSVERDKIIDQASRLAADLVSHLEPPPQTSVIPADLLTRTNQELMSLTDSHYGGFGSAPKFPQEANLLYLLDQVSRSVKPLAEQPEWSLLKTALDAMLQGGIYDQLGGGFHRYATDRHWLVPHFEKMLYNQGQLVRVYSHAYQLCGDPEYRRVACEILDYVLRELGSDQGLFHSATDADSESVEGKYFVWQATEIESLLSPEEFTLAEKVWGITQTGNFEGASILYLPLPLAEVANRLALSYADLTAQLQRIKAKLYARRQSRIPPLTDTKIITEWNGMIIAALAEASRIFRRPDYLQAAVTAADQLWELQRQADGKLWRISMNGEGSGKALLEDYAHFMEACLQVYDSSNEPVYLSRCQTLLKNLEQHYLDTKNGGFYTSQKDAAGPLLVRSKGLGDNATICGNSQILIVLARLSQRTGDRHLQKLWQNHITAFADRVKQYPLSALMFLQGIAETGESNPTGIQYRAEGQLSAWIEEAEEMPEAELRLTLRLKMNPGWHIQNNQISIRLPSATTQEITGIRYPRSSGQASNDAGELFVCTDACDIDVTLKGCTQEPVRLALHVQPCNENECLPETVMKFVHWPALSPDFSLINHS